MTLHAHAPSEASSGMPLKRQRVEVGQGLGGLNLVSCHQDIWRN